MDSSETAGTEIAGADAAAGLRPHSTSPNAQGSRQEEEGLQGQAPAVSSEGREEGVPSLKPAVIQDNETTSLKQNQVWPDDLEEVPLEASPPKMIKCPMNQDEIDDLHMMAEKLDLQEMVQMYEFARVSCSETEDVYQNESTGSFCSTSATCGLGVDSRHEGYKPLHVEIASKEDMEELVGAAEALAPQEMLELYELAKKLFCKSDLSTAQEKPTTVRDESIDTVNSSAIQAALQVCAHVEEIFGDSLFGKPALDYSWDAEFSFQITDKNFSIQSMPKSAQQSWRSRYTLGAKVGEGGQATVYKARTKPTSSEDLLNKMGCGWQVAATAGSKVANRDNLFCGTCATGQGRLVAAKLFNRRGSQAFKQELEAMQLVSVHPNIARLLESFQNDNREDVLIMEMFDCDLYDLYRQWFYPMSALLDRLIARVIKQLLLAIDHLIMCGVNHRDVKLENIMVYNMIDLENIEIKLGDFGWAAAAGRNDEQQVCGTLWYAPPELSPAIPGMTSNVCLEQVPAGLSDMWSVGVIAYLLHVGHNPFKHIGRDTTASSAMRYAAEGKIDTKSVRWKRLAPEARHFIHRLLQVDPHARPTPSEILEHQYFTKWPKSASTSEVTLQARLVASHTRWEDLDGLQRLGWVAMARAVAEPELDNEMVLTALSPGAAMRDSRAYLLQLAKELAVQPVVNKAWLDVMGFAFRYLDADGDGLLSAQDLLCHVYDSNKESSNSSQCHAAAELWVHRWSKRGKHLNLLEFHSALLSKCFARGPSQVAGQYDNVHNDKNPFLGPGVTVPSLSALSDRRASDEECCWADIITAGGSPTDRWVPRTVYL